MEIRQFRVVLKARDFDRTCSFYGETLALPRLQSWDRESGRGAPTQRYYHLPADWLQDGPNVLVLFDETGGDPSSIRICEWTEEPK